MILTLMQLIYNKRGKNMSDIISNVNKAIPISESLPNNVAEAKQIVDDLDAQTNKALNVLDGLIEFFSSNNIALETAYTSCLGFAIAVDDYVQTEFGSFMAFEVLTMVPYEKKLIDLKYLDDSEIEQINAYHQWIKEELIGLVDEDAKAYLESATSPLVRE